MDAKGGSMQYLIKIILLAIMLTGFSMQVSAVGVVKECVISADEEADEKKGEGESQEEEEPDCD